MENFEKQTLTAESLYDLSMLEEMDDAEYLLEVLDLFLQETPKDLDELQRAFGSGKTDALYKRAHKLKSSAGVIQADGFALILADIESLGKKGIINEEVKQLVQQALEEYRSIEKCLQKYVATLQ